MHFNVVPWQIGNTVQGYVIFVPFLVGNATLRFFDRCLGWVKFEKNKSDSGDHTWQASKKNKSRFHIFGFPKLTESLRDQQVSFGKHRSINPTAPQRLTFAGLVTKRDMSLGEHQICCLTSCYWVISSDEKHPPMRTPKQTTTFTTHSSINSRQRKRHVRVKCPKSTHAALTWYQQEAAWEYRNAWTQCALVFDDDGADPPACQNVSNQIVLIQHFITQSKMSTLANESSVIFTFQIKAQRIRIRQFI